MAKQRTIYIFEGHDNYCLVKGTRHTGDLLREMMIKHLGLFKRTKPALNIGSELFGQPKVWIVDDKPKPGWEVIKVKMNILTREPNYTDIDPDIQAKLISLKNEAELWKRRYHDALSINISRMSADKFTEKIKKDMKRAGEIKNLLYQSDGYSSFGSYGWGGYPRTLNTISETQ